MIAMLMHPRFRLRGNLASVVSQGSDFVLSEVGCFKIVGDVVLNVCCFVHSFNVFTC